MKEEINDKDRIGCFSFYIWFWLQMDAKKVFEVSYQK